MAALPQASRNSTIKTTIPVAHLMSKIKTGSGLIETDDSLCLPIIVVITKDVDANLLPALVFTAYHGSAPQIGPPLA